MAALEGGPPARPPSRRVSAPNLSAHPARGPHASQRHSTGSTLRRQSRQSAKPSDIEVYENEVRSFVGGAWGAAAQPWSRKDGVPCPPRDEYPVPEGHQWCGNWKIDFSDCQDGAGERDKDGWEYATTSKKLGPNRVARNQTMKDLARRRRWVRPMARVADSAQLNNDHLDNVRIGLEKLAKAREEVAKMGRRLGTTKDSQQMRETVEQYVRRVRDAQAAVREHLRSLETGDNNPNASEREQRDARAVRSKVQKLGRELERESTTFERLASQLKDTMRNRPLPEPDGSGGGGGGGGGAGGGLRAAGLSYNGNSPGSIGGGSQSSSTASGSVDETNARYSKRAFSTTVQTGEGAFVARGGASGGVPEDGAYLTRQEQDDLILAKLKDIDGQSVDEAILREREAQIQAVHESVVVLNSLFKDMANLTQQQQEGIDAIEANVTAASNKTKDALVDLEAAADHQRKACVVS